MCKDEIVKLLSIPNMSNEYYNLLAHAAEYAQKTFKGKGYVFAQIGLNSDPCSGNCKFCSLAQDFYAMENADEKTVEEVAAIAKNISEKKVSDLFLMTTADYDKEKFLKMIEAAKKNAPKQKIVANVGDFDFEYAKRLKSRGVEAVYHIRRLREGTDTALKAKVREQTINFAQKAGLEVYYCIEPIGPEHSYEEIADEILFAQSLNTSVMAVMKRIAVQNTPKAAEGEISSAELLKIAAVALLAVRPARSMNIHEPMQSACLAGVNQLYAEIGFNPRDTVSVTENGRGMSIDGAVKILKDFGYEI